MGAAGIRARAIPILKGAIWIGALVPLGLLAFELFGGTVVVDDPVELIQRRTGLSALILLFLTLSVTPIRRITGWNRLVRVRRLLGLFAFFHATLHAFSYFVFDQELSPAAIAADIVEHPWVLVGFTAFVLLVPLAVTSTNGWIRRLGGRRWARLHMLVYLVPVLGVLHFLWLVKADVTEPLTYGAILAAILSARLALWWTGRRKEPAAAAARPAPAARRQGARPS
jgi:sulfoxide reductase heme-binding subunit YedZ